MAYAQPDSAFHYQIKGRIVDRSVILRIPIFGVVTTLYTLKNPYKLPSGGWREN